MDKRKNNGGHSTKAKNPLTDRRKHQFKDVVHRALKPQELEDVFKMLYDKAVNEQDTSAAKLLIEYTVGKPTQNIDLETNVINSIPLESLVSFKGDTIIEIEESTETKEDGEDRTES